jgi:hypothetical protein
MRFVVKALVMLMRCYVQCVEVDAVCCVVVDAQNIFVARCQSCIRSMVYHFVLDHWMTEAGESRMDIMIVVIFDLRVVTGVLLRSIVLFMTSLFRCLRTLFRSCQ